MDFFEYKNNKLYAEEVSIEAIAEAFGTPCYVYSQKTVTHHYHVFSNALKSQSHCIHYAVKANSNLAILHVLAALGSGFDIVSGGELARVLKAGGDAKKIVFSGVGKLSWEIEAALNADIGCFNVESMAELNRIQTIAKALNKTANIALRVNPDVDAKTHPYISTGLKENKFGIAIEKAVPVYRQANQLSHVKVLGVACHIGSQLTEVTPYVETMDRLLGLIDALDEEGISIRHLDVGGGLGVRYRDETPPSPQEFVDAILPALKGRDLQLSIEPGRAMVANAGILISRVEYLKNNSKKNFAVVDAAMNDLLRPALYQAWQDIIPVNKNSSEQKQIYDVVGPVCETADFLGKDRELALQPGDLIAVRGAGAYGFTMSSNYNSRGRAAEVIVNGDQVRCVRKRETIEELFASESC